MSTRLAWAVAVLGVVALALFLRVYWNVDAAVEDGGGFRLASGSDPYYHKRAIDWTQENGWTTLIRDPLLNYPYGSVNPNPPLFEWAVAATGLALSPFFGGDLETATWWALLWNPAIMGALTVVPIYVIGAALFHRRAGILAGIFWALSASSMDHTSLGASDHDAFYLFFLVMGFAFYVKFIHMIRNDPSWVVRWSDGASISAGFGRFWAERKLALAYAALAGISLAAVALTWKGFPYATGIVFVYASLQLVVDHWRNRDSLGLWLGTLLAIGLPVLLALPYYAAATVTSFLLPASYLVLGFFVAGLVLVPTRDLPSLLVLPAALVVAAIGVALTWVVPALTFVRVQLLYATVYFRQSRLYTTIAEAHPASFDDIVFGIGPIVFLVGVVALGWLLLTARRNASRDTLFTFTWGLIAIYMAQSAVRFLFNAVPVFVILGGWLIAEAIAWFDFGALTRGIREGGWGSGLRRTFSLWHPVGVFAIVILLVIPSVLLAVDAAVPGEVEQRIVEDAGAESALGKFVEKRFGAYTQGFLPGYWEDGLEWLDEHDAAIADPAERPAFLSWWDYGHWAIAVGRHPASADNFQNGYEHAGNFIASRNESHAIQLLAARQVERGFVDEATTKQFLGTAGVTDVDVAYEKLRTFQFIPELDTESAVAFNALIEQQTGKRIRYFAVDSRMLAYDSPQTPYLDLQGIFYAPIYLAGKNVEEYVETRFQGNDGGDYNQTQVERLYKLAASGGAASTFQVVGESYVYRQPFFESMFWRGYSGAPPRGEGPTWKGDALEEGLDGPSPAFAMQHFRLVYMNDNLRILEYYPGAKVSGVVLQDGQPLAGAFVTVFDDAGSIIYDFTGPRTKSLATDPTQLDVAHDRGLTDADGRFTLTAPFGMTHGVTFVAVQGGVELGRQTIQVTREQAESGADLGRIVTFNIDPGAIAGKAFYDTDGDGEFNVTTDRYLSGVNLTIGGRNVTSASDGSYVVERVPPGASTVSTTEATYEVSPVSRTVRVRPNQTTTHDVGLILRFADAGGRIGTDVDGDGLFGPLEAISGFPYELKVDEGVAGNTAQLVTGTTDQSGNWTARLRPGSYVFRANYQNQEGESFEIEDRFTVAEGTRVFARDFLLLKS
ncbi:MAG TPA: STT3 domain-containing protein [Candidatus Thermoplasmatota archaeon]|nr:STT3 domain-containing protein [Candidatus Thermoplasmatota archaeon]